ncbi:hypothetical protein QQ008_13300 [Fulvivirgaceae bacterium BMA10]|uniref:DUF7973 domain-containing protein n=1 Tax=Splendidivirga corallicola TaxID=3051826 RepID=A0ABT8KNR8_9BACT|nr:hypothetical protein [Fulvivirgaceae bacterium BMA10]
MELSDITYLILAFCGGMIGTSLGGLNAFVLCGLSAVIGTVYAMITGDQSFNQYITWGPLLSPHIAFGGAVAGAAYAAKIKKIETGRDISSALMGINQPSVLLIAGGFGMLGEVVRRGLILLPSVEGLPATNEIAMALIVSGLVVRLLFGKTGLFGSLQPNQSRWKTDVSAEWQPWSLPSLQLVLVGIAFSLPAAFINNTIPDSTGLIFGFAAISLIFFQAGATIPVTHHIVLAAEYATVITGNLWWGACFGLLSAFVAELAACLFLTHGDTHIDPPAIALIVIYSLLPLLLSTTSIFQFVGYVPVSLFFLLAVLGLLFFRWLKGKA